jgi:hypothetical protein
MSAKPCSFLPCGIAAWARGLCPGHLGQTKAVRPLTEILRDPVRRFWARVDKSPAHGGCWLWTGAKNWAGYAWVGFKGKRIAVHRLAYTLTKGPIPPARDVDHVRANGCRYRHCVNPDHLEPVTHRVNLLRGRGPEIVRARAAAITHCPRGHAYADHAYVTPSGGRTCKICQVERTRAWRAARAERAVA